MRFVICSLLSVLSLTAWAKGEPEALKIPVNKNTVPADTTDRNVKPSNDVDNTRKNEVHDGTSAVTADQQGNSKADVELTSRIRRAIVADKDLSTYAHNVKIISYDGRVILKGPVRSNEEKQKIETLAKTIATDGQVLSEIEVK